jgi:hypothetical protein
MNIRQLREGRLVARNYSDVFQDDRAVDKYERVQYAVDSHSTAVNERQRQYLRALVPASFRTRVRPSTTSPAALAVASTCWPVSSRPPTGTTSRPA